MSPILVAGNGQGKILIPDELRRLFTDKLRSERDHAMLGICLFTGCPLSYALALQTTDIKGETLTFVQFGLVALDISKNPRTSSVPSS